MWANRFALVVVTSFGASLSLGCSSAYIPAPGPRVALIMDGGQYAYVRDGKKYNGGIFGGDIEEAVQGDPKAEEYARAYKAGMVSGFALTMVGAVGVIGGAAIVGAQASGNNGPSPSATGLAVMGGGLVVELIGIVLALNAHPHLFDAINAYNDQVRLGGEAPAASR